jgi:hypothetical protein
MAVKPSANIAVHVEQARSLAISLRVVLGELASIVSSSPDGFSSSKTGISLVWNMSGPGIIQGVILFSALQGNLANCRKSFNS